MFSARFDLWRFCAIGLGTGFGLAAVLAGVWGESHVLAIGSALALLLVLASSWALHRSLRNSRIAELRLRTLVESAPDALFIVDKHGHITLANAQAEATFGWPREALLGQSIDMLVPASMRGGHARLREGYSERPRRRPMHTGLELMGQRRDGTVVPVEIALSPLPPGTGDAVIAAVRDVAARHQAEEALRKAHAEVEDLYDNAPCGYHTVDKEMRILRVNQTELDWLGYTREEMIGHSVAEFQTEASRQKLRRLFCEVSILDPVDHIEAEFVRKDGTVLPVLLNATALLDENGQFVCRRATLLDITELQKERDERELRIQEALAEVKTLHGLLPICAWCKKIRSDDGNYLPLETYLHDHTGVGFSHGMCPDCLAGMVQDMDRQDG